jgi:hypothetical protein
MHIVIDIDTGEAAAHVTTPTSPSMPTSSADVDAGAAAVGQSGSTATVDKAASATVTAGAVEDVDAGAAGGNADNQPAPADEQGVDAGPAPEF